MLVLGRIGKAQRLAVAERVDDAKGVGLACVLRIRIQFSGLFTDWIIRDQTSELPFDGPAFGDAALVIESGQFQVPVRIKRCHALIDDCEAHFQSFAVAGEVGGWDMKIGDCSIGIDAG